MHMANFMNLFGQRTRSSEVVISEERLKMAEKDNVATDVVTCYDGVFKGMYNDKLGELYQEGRRLIAVGKWEEGKDIFKKALEMSQDHPLDKKTLRIVISEMARAELYEIKKNIKPADIIDWMNVTEREIKRLDESLFDTPQSIFFLQVGLPGHPGSRRLIGRRLLSDWWVSMKIPDIHCSFVNANMILGLFIDQRIGDSAVTVYYHPLENAEKLKIMNDIKETTGKDVELIFPFPLLQESTRQERNSPPEGWMVDEAFETYLGCGEERIRKYSIQFLKDVGLETPLLYDPACSTGEFLSTMQKAAPGCYTFGQDLSQQMANLASKRIDEAHCANAATPKIKPESADVVYIRFLNSEVVKTSEAEPLLHALLPTVKSRGYIIIFGHTPVLLSSANLRCLQGFQLRQCVGIPENESGMFQYYVLVKK